MAKTRKKSRSRYGKSCKTRACKVSRRRKASKGRHLPKMPVGHCGKCGRTIFGGAKGMATHNRKNHRGGRKGRR